MTAGIHGDPASCSQAGGSLRRLSSRLEAAAARAEQAATEVEHAWSGRVARAVGQRQRLLLETAREAAAELDGAGSLLQEHATDLADALHELRDVEGRASAAGLRVVDARVELPWGVAGVADEEAAAARDAVRSELQARLDTVLLQLARRRARLAAALEAATGSLADSAAGLRS